MSAPESGRRYARGDGRGGSERFDRRSRTVRPPFDEFGIDTRR
ncbi:hypothetical protein V5735_20975 (plasmid) [Haladaptatus sp. SPP-AMP-3]